MAYVKGLAVQNATDMATIFKAFVTSNSSYTYEGDSLPGDTTSPIFKGADGVYYNFKFNPTTIHTSLSESKPSGNITSGTNNSALQESNMYAKTTNFKYPIVSHHMFSDGNIVILVLEISSGVYRHHAFGKMSSFGIVSGGNFTGGTMTSSNSNYELKNTTNVYDITVWSNSYNYIHPFAFGYKDSSPGGTMAQGRNFIKHKGAYTPYMLNDRNNLATPNSLYFVQRNQYLYGAGCNNYNARVQLYPVIYYEALFASPNYHMKPCFFAPNVALVDVYSLNAEDVINNDWVVFPLVTKSKTITGDLRSNNYGIAYKK